MRLRLLLLSLLLCARLATPVWAGAPSRTYTYTTGQIINPSHVTTNEDNLYAYLQSGVDTYAVGSVNTAAVADNAVTAAKVAAGSIDVNKFATTGTSADDKVFVADSSTAGTWRALTNCTDTSGNHLNYTASTNTFSCGTTSSTTSFTSSAKVGEFTRDTSLASGTQTVSGLGLTPIEVIVTCTQAGSTGEASYLGMSDGTTNGVMFDDHGVTANTNNATAGSAIFDNESSGVRYSGSIGSFSSGQFVVTWTRTGAPTGTQTCEYVARN